MSNLTLRIISAALLGSVALAALYFGGWFWLTLIAAAAIGMSFEWATLVQLPQKTILSTVTAIAVLSALADARFYGIERPSITLLTLAIVLVFLGLVTGHSAVKRFGFGLAYIGIPVLALYWIRNLPDPMGYITTLWLLLTIWATDSFAYFVGRAVGGPKFLPTISPKKTWSGALGGLLGGAVVAITMHNIFALSGSLTGLIISSVAVSMLSQFGDALESAVKRDFNVKDSGQLIPGHGGLFDRLDGLLVTAPVVAAAMIIQEGGAIALIGDRL